MKTDAAKRTIIKVASQESQSSSQESIKNPRRTLKLLQQTASDKENLTGRPFKDIKLAKSEIETTKIKPKTLVNKAVQTNECVITEDDLTSDEPSSDYWRKLAEKRGVDLNDSLKENERLKENVEALKEENKICKSMLAESENLVEILKELLEEDDPPVNPEENEGSS